MNGRIAVYGATGTTGALVVKEVVRCGLSCRALGRDAGALAALRDVETAACAVTALAPALTGVDLVINCAGPFSDTRRAVEDAAIEAGIHVVHICGELPELTEMFARMQTCATRTSPSSAPPASPRLSPSSRAGSPSRG